MSGNRRRRLVNRAARVAMYATVVIALVPIAMILVFTAVQGLPAVTHVEFFVNAQRPQGVPGGGVANALAGTLVMVAVASAGAMPLGVVSGVYLAEYGTGRLAAGIRLSCDVLVSIPSIVIGLFVYRVFVAGLVHHFSGFAGAMALGVLMLPVVARTTEGAVALVPGALREAGLALGLARWRVSLLLVLPAAVPGVLTGALLAVARAAGETAPLLFTALGNELLNFDPGTAMSALPLVVFDFSRTSFPDLVQTAWGAALVLVVLTLLVNVLSRLALRHQIRLAGRI